MASSGTGGRTDTKEAILDLAEQLVQVRGFNGFSYTDVSSELGVTNAALHYHFSGKAELGLALIARYAERFTESLDAIERSGASPLGELRAYAALYQGVLETGRMCLCGMLAAEHATLPGPMRLAVTEFFDVNHAWLTRVLEAGRADGTIGFVGLPTEAAELIVGTLEGAMLVARTYGDAGRFKAVSEQLLAEFTRTEALS